MTGRMKTERRAFASVAQLLDWATLRLARARLHYGHGTDNPRDDAAALVFHALGLAHESAPASYRLPVAAAGAARAQALVERRIRRAPAVGLPHGRQLVRRPRDPRDARRPRAALADRGALPRRVRAVDRSRARASACSTSAPDRAASRSRPHMPCPGRAWTRPMSRRRPWRSPARTCGGTASGAACASCAPMSMKASEAGATMSS